MSKLLRTPILLFVLAGPGCARPCKPPRTPTPSVVTVESRCLTQPPPNPPPALATELAGDAPLTPAAADLFEQWAAALVRYGARAWRDCGTPAPAPTLDR